MKIEKKLLCFKRSHRQRAGNGFVIKEKNIIALVNQTDRRKHSLE